MKVTKFPAFLLLVSLLFLSLVACSDEDTNADSGPKIDVVFSEFNVEPWTFFATISSAEISIAGTDDAAVEKGFIYDYASKDTLIMGQGAKLTAEGPVVDSEVYTLETQPDSLYKVRGYVLHKKTGKVFLGPIQKFRALKEIEVFFMVSNLTGTSITVSGNITNRTGKSISEASLNVSRIPPPGIFTLPIELKNDNTFEVTHNNLLVKGANYFLFATVIVDGKAYTGGNVTIENN